MYNKMSTFDKFKHTYHCCTSSTGFLQKYNQKNLCTWNNKKA